jgi:hypothetical protein
VGLFPDNSKICARRPHVGTGPTTISISNWPNGIGAGHILPYEFESFEFVVVNLGVGKSGITLAIKSGGKSAPVGGVSNTLSLLFLRDFVHLN